MFVNRYMIRCLSLDGSSPWAAVPMEEDTTIIPTQWFEDVTALYLLTFMCQVSENIFWTVLLQLL